MRLARSRSRARRRCSWARGAGIAAALPLPCHWKLTRCHVRVTRRDRRVPLLARGTLERGPDPARVVGSADRRRLGVPGLAESHGGCGTLPPGELGSGTYSRGEAVDPPGGLGQMMGGPVVLEHGTDEAEGPLAAGAGVGARVVVPAVQRTGRRFRPRQRPDASRARRRRLDGQRPEGLDVRCRAPTGDARRPHRPRRAEAQGHHLLHHRHGPAGRRGPAAATPDGRRGHLRKCSSPAPWCPTTPPSRSPNNGWMVAGVDARPTNARAWAAEAAPHFWQWAPR